VAVGRVVKFNAAHGFGFIQPSAGGDDVFLHVNDLTFPEEYLRVGQTVEFEMTRGDRGPKALSVRLPERGGAPLPPPVWKPPPPPPAAAAVSDSASALAGLGDDDVCDVLTVDEFKTQVTEALMARCDSLTADQILAVRQAFAEVAASHKWVE
jgi:cold shock CspA family protein